MKDAAKSKPKKIFNPANRKELNAELARQEKLMPRDTRSLTGRIMGDPIPDSRAPWRGGGRAEA